MTAIHQPQYYSASPSQRPISFYDNYLVTNFQNGDMNFDDSSEEQPTYQQPLDDRPSFTAPIVMPEEIEDDEDQYTNCDISDSRHSAALDDSTKPKQIVFQSNHSFKNSNNNLKNKSASNSVDATPSLRYCLETTVPQNLSASKIAGRHAPTRNSLRHSRLVVMSRTGRAEKYKRKGLLIRRQGFGRLLAWLQTVLGFCISMLALWLLLWAPNISPKINPYWSAVPLSISGIVGLLLLGCCQRRKYKDAKHFCAQSSKIVSIFLAFIACIACSIAAAFAIIHFITLSQMVCAPEYGLDTTCICRRDTILNETGFTGWWFSQTNGYYHYIDLSCPDVDIILNILLIFSAAVNGLAVLLTISYLYIHWRSRNLHTYTSVRTN